MADALKDIEIVFASQDVIFDSKPIKLHLLTCVNSLERLLSRTFGMYITVCTLTVACVILNNRWLKRSMLVERKLVS